MRLIWVGIIIAVLLLTALDVSSQLSCSLQGTMAKKSPNLVPNPGFDMLRLFSCVRKDACNATEFTLMKLSNGTAYSSRPLYNAHVQQPWTLPGYPNSVCCTRALGYYNNTFMIEGNPNPKFTTALRISDSTSGHAELNNSALDIPPIPYDANKIKISAKPVKREFKCDLVEDRTNAGEVTCKNNNYDTCIVELSSIISAHVADCTFGHYPYKVCCKLITK
jgi:hypothetical protein